MHRVPGRKVNWTPEMDAEIINSRNAGVHKSLIAEKLGLTIAAVDSRYFRLKKSMSGDTK